MNRRYLLSVSFVVVLLVANCATAGRRRSISYYGCGGGCGQVQYVEQTICEPQWVTETRKVTVCEYRQEQKQRTRTVYRCVPETKQVGRTCTVMVAETRVRKVPYTVCKPVVKNVERQYTVCVPEWKQVEKKYTVMVPHQEIRQGVRRVCQMVEEQVTDTVTVDRGHWQSVQKGSVQKGAFQKGAVQKGGTQMACQQVWVPNLVEEQVTHTVCKPQIVEEPYQYAATVCKPETRTCMVSVCEMRQEVRSETCQVTTYETSMVEREEYFTVCVPKVKKWTETVTVNKQVPEQVTERYTVCVPYQVEKEVQVQVCRMVPKNGDGSGLVGLLRFVLPEDVLPEITTA